MCATQVDEITNIVTDVTGDPTLPRLIETSCSVLSHHQQCQGFEYTITIPA